ncbi:hypothetical protein [Fibrella aquatilis]|uniref:NADH-quinone oxidoreductase subunit E n=1 Tax=Fibrella aquatilis TaxID=2817059 RepID=A0A939G9J8_9BACT|nr:hypothetical protein [Fibrella aquatilis]MBO0932612.1 hypothetical protein [Fibrella aquatilis]
MFGLDPFSRPVAITEALLILSLAAFVGWLLGRLVLNGRISALQADIADKEAALDDCRRAKAAPSVNTQRAAAPVMTTPVVAAPVVEAPVVAVAAPVVEVPAMHVPSVEVPAMAAAAAVAAPVMEKITTVATPAPAPVPMGGSEDVVLNRIAARASEINFDRIGRATAAEADDLKDIVGVGPFLERKLHSLGIYTFRQVANFTKEDIAKVNEIIEFFPGRIQRDNWVDQSKSFYETKYGKKHDA